MPGKQLTPEEMDGMAEVAAQELLEMDGTIEGWHKIQTIPELAVWWRKWYMVAGHKRLGRIIMGVK